MSSCKTIVAIPSYVYDAVNKDIDWLFNCFSKLDGIDICCDVSGSLGLEEKLSKNDIMDMVVLNKFVQSNLSGNLISLCDGPEQTVYEDLKKMSMSSLEAVVSPDNSMSSMHNLTPWIFESRGDILFVILQDIFIGFIVKGGREQELKFLVETLSAYKRYYGEEATLQTQYFRRFIRLVL